MCIVGKLYFGSKILRVYRYLYCVALPSGSATQYIILKMHNNLLLLIDKSLKNTANSASASAAGLPIPHG